MASRPHTFRLRLSDEELTDLEERAGRGGYTKADTIRAALGWEPERKSSKVGPMARSIASSATAEEKADPKSEPGKAVIERLAKQIRNREGVTTPVARRQAKRELEGNRNET